MDMGASQGIPGESSNPPAATGTTQPSNSTLLMLNLQQNLDEVKEMQEDEEEKEESDEDKPDDPNKRRVRFRD